MASTATDSNSDSANHGWDAPIVAFLSDFISDIGSLTIEWLVALGDMTTFMFRTASWLCTRLPRRATLLPNFYQIGVLSLPVVALTGTFIGMVLGRAKLFAIQDVSA